MPPAASLDGMSGTPVSTERLWGLLSGQLRSFFARRVPDPQAAEDLLQETFLRIHRALERWPDGERLEAWVFRIARNLLIDHRRRRPLAVSDDLRPEAVPEDDEVGAGNLNDVVRDWLPAMIDELPAPYAEAVRMVELEGLPQQEIADRLGLSLSGAKSRVQRGREKLKQALFDCCTFQRDRRGNVIGYDCNDPGDAGCDDD